jgi:hypothetical protein
MHSTFTEHITTDKHADTAWRLLALTASGVLAIWRVKPDLGLTTLSNHHQQRQHTGPPQSAANT